MVNSTRERIAREDEARRGAQMQEFRPPEPQFGEDLPGVEGKYTETLVDPQWLPAWKLLLDENGNEYGIPVTLPAGQWNQGGPNALMNQRRVDGGYHFSLIEPERKAPQPTIECIYEKCGDVHVGGRRKMLFTLTDLIEHVETFHPREAKVYRKYLDEIANNVALGNERLQRLRQASMVGLPAAAGPSLGGAEQAEVFHCEREDCRRFFDTEQGRRLHMVKEHRT